MPYDLEWLRELAEIEAQLQYALIETILVIAILGFVHRIVNRIVNARIDDAQKRYQWHKVIAYLTVIVSILLITPLWLIDFQAAGTFLGLLSAGLAISLQKPLNNLAGWLFIVVVRPFQVGDRVQIGEYTGDVIDIRFFQFTLMEIGNWVDADQSTGRILHIPNVKVFVDPLANFNKGFMYIWNELPVHITFESNWEKAKSILQKIADEQVAPMTRDAAQNIKKDPSSYLIIYSKFTPIVYTRVEQNGVLLTIRYLCLPRTRRSTEQLIWEHVLRSFAQHADIEFAYPTQRFYQRSFEQKMPMPTTTPRTNGYS